MAQETASFYRIVEGSLQPIGPERLGEECQLVAYLNPQQLLQHAQALNIEPSLLQEYTADHNRLRNSVDVLPRHSIGLINLINLEDPDGDRDQLLFIAKKDAFLLVKLEDKDGSVRAMFQTVVERYQSGVTLERFVYGILERCLLGGGKKMEEMDLQMLRMEKQLVEGRVNKSLNRTIYRLRQRLTALHNFYEQLIDIGEELHENENEVFDPNNLQYFHVFVSKAERLAQSAHLKGENLVHLREALDAELNYTLNSVMKLFTVLTAIFAPLTLIVGWYGMNFKHMPELDWPWAYPALFGLCVLLTVIILLIFRRKRLM